MTSLRGRVALVTGGGSGIGRAVVDALRREGARVGVLELDPRKVRSLSAGADPELVVVEGNATSFEDNRRLVAQVLDHWRHVDIVMTFVGLFDHYLSLEEIPIDRMDAAFTELFATNVKSVLTTARAAIGSLRISRGSLVVTLSSSSFYPGRGGVLYVASKFALRGVVVQLAHELAPDVRVNGVAPGGTVDTDLRGVRSLGQYHKRLDDRPGRREELQARTPLRVALTGADHVGAYLYLASDAARGVTGEIIRSDGGIGVR